MPAPTEKMPAVSLVKLKKQIESLVWLYTQPAEFADALRGILEQYADHTYRPSAANPESSRSIGAYHVPPIVIRQIELALNHLISENPSPAIKLANHLWRENKEEPRLLAIFIAGTIPASASDSVITLIKQWAEEETDQILLERLFSEGTITLRRFAIQNWLNTIEEWLADSSERVQKRGLMAILPLIKDRQFENIPIVFNLCTPIFYNYPKAHGYELTSLLIALAERTPAELVFYIRQLVGSSNSPDLHRLIRRCLPAFPKEIQERIRPMLKRE